MADCKAVQGTIRLRARRAHGRPFGAIQDAKLDPRLIGGQGHGAAQGVDFLDQMPLANSTNGGVARHLPQGFHIVRQQQGFRATARSRQRGLRPRVAAAHHNHVEGFRVLHDIEQGRRAANYTVAILVFHVKHKIRHLQQPCCWGVRFRFSTRLRQFRCFT